MHGIKVGNLTSYCPDTAYIPVYFIIYSAGDITDNSHHFLEGRIVTKAEHICVTAQCRRGIYEVIIVFMFKYTEYVRYSLTAENKLATLPCRDKIGRASCRERVF